MTSPRARWIWIPAFLAGAAVATAGELAAGILLYSGEGFLRSLSFVLATELGALALGFWAHPAETGGDAWGEEAVDSARRRWLFVLVAFSGAVLFAGAWGLTGGFSVAIGQGLGLALLAGFPFYSVGTLLAAMSPEAAGERRGTMRWPDPRVGALLGAAAGVLVTGLVLVPRMELASILLLCLVVLAGGALIHGWILDSRTVIRPVEELPSPFGPVRVEERRTGSGKRRWRVLLENGRLRGGEDAGGRAVRMWERAVPALLEATVPAAERIVLVGCGSYVLAEDLSRIFPEAHVVVVERNPEVARAARRHFRDPMAAGKVELLTGEPWSRALGSGGPIDLLVVDADAVRGRDPVPRLSRELLLGLRERLAPGGAVVIAPIPEFRADPGAAAHHLLADVGEVFGKSVLYWVPAERSDAAASPSLVLGLSAEGGREWPRSIPGLERVIHPVSPTGTAAAPSVSAAGPIGEIR